MQKNMLGAYGKWTADSGGDGPGTLSFRNPRWTEIGPWRNAARAKLHELLREPQGVRAEDVKVHSRSELDGLLIEDLSWQLPWGPRTGAYFLKPRGAKGRLPGVIALHDHGGNKYFGKRKIANVSTRLHPMMERHQRDYYGGAGWANQIAKRGFGVLVPDVFPFESRRVLASDLPAHVVERMMCHPEQVREMSPEDLLGAGNVMRYEVPADEPNAAIDAYNAFAAQHESIVAKSLFCAGLAWPGLMVAEDGAALGYLASREDIDGERIGCCGLSGGGLRTDFLAGTDDRIRCAVSVGMMTTWRDFLLHTSHTHTWMIYVPGLPGLFDFSEILGLRAPLPTLVLSKAEDPLFTRTETERAAGMLEEVYRKAGAPEAFRFSMHPGPHRFDLPMQDEAFGWLETWLGKAE
jgi:dienelactone hydrolase